MQCRTKQKFYAMYILVCSIRKIIVPQTASALAVMIASCQMIAAKPNVRLSAANAANKQSSDCFFHKSASV